MKIVFGIMSAVQSAASVTQLVDALAPHAVAIHHDSHQNPDFRVSRSTVSFVPSPSRTGWAVWGFSEGILKLMRHALEDLEADYFQLLTPTCLPIRPITEFEHFVASKQHDVHITTADFTAEDDLLVNFGYRAFVPEDSFRYRLMVRLRQDYFGDSPMREMCGNLQTLRRRSGPQSVVDSAAVLLNRIAQRGWLGSHPFQSRFRPRVGATWFGCTATAGRYLLEQLQDPHIWQFFSRMRIADEMMFPSIFASSPFRIGPSNHLVNRFVEGSPALFTPDDVRMLLTSGKFFARKFKDDPQAPERLAVLRAITPAPEPVVAMNARKTEASVPAPEPHDARTH